MPRISVTSIARIQPARNFVSASRLLSSSSQSGKGSQNSSPGWEGRHGDDHVVNRSANDVQAKASQSAMKDKAQGKEGSGAISQKDERNANERAKEEFPEAPGPVIGMNSERGGKS